MILKYNYSNIITKKDQKNSINLVDTLIKSGNWCKEVPHFQTWANLHQYKEFEIFEKTFLNSCYMYLNITHNIDFKILMWVYKSNFFNSKKNNSLDLWHEHSKGNLKKISGIYYLKNLRHEGTEFKDFKITKPESYTWYIYPSHLLHKPPTIKSFRNRYTIAADFEPLCL